MCKDFKWNHILTVATCFSTHKHQILEHLELILFNDYIVLMFLLFFHIFIGV